MLPLQSSVKVNTLLSLVRNRVAQPELAFETLTRTFIDITQQLCAGKDDSN